MWLAMYAYQIHKTLLLTKTLCRKRKSGLNFLQGQQSITKLSSQTGDFGKYKNC